MRYKMTYILFLFFLLTTIPYIITIYINKENKKNISFENYDSGYKIQDKDQDIDLESYLLKILPGQISMDQEEETIKCQAVILRTDLIRKMGRSKKIKMESIPYQMYKDEQYKSKLGDRAYEIMDQKRKKAVKETIGKVITYKGALIEPYFHAVSVGMTLDASEWFGKKIPYLRQKESLSDIESKDYMSIKTISYQRMQITLEEHMKKKITIQQLQKNLRLLTVTKNGYVKQIKAGSYIISGEDFARWLQLASNNFYFEQYKGNLRIICLGKGNGLGLSQYGAEQMAKQGKNYQKILKYYYPKTMIKKLYE